MYRLQMIEQLYSPALTWIFEASNNIHVHLCSIVFNRIYIYQHQEIRSSIVKYIEQERDHFSLFMDDEELFEEYTDRMK